MNRRPLIVVSNRGPVAFGRDHDGARVARRGAGGLATALRGLLVRQDVTWIASAISEEDQAVAAEADGVVPEGAGAPCRLRLLTFDPGSYDGYYNVVANPLLWFVQHSLYGLGDQPVLDESFARAWSSYAEVNNAFADAVVAELDNTPHAAVLFHDYHLYLAPRFVREARPDALLAHFVHIPWPQSDGWTVLPDAERRAVHDGLLANDLVGFHTHRWRRNFLASVADVLGTASIGRAGSCIAGARPPSRAVRSRSTATSSTRLRRARPCSTRRRASAGLVPSGSCCASIAPIRRRTSCAGSARSGCCSTGIRNGAAGCRCSRCSTPRAWTSPSTRHTAAIEREAATVNARHSSAGYEPIDVHVADDFPLTIAGYKHYDVLLVNAVFDGLNLVAKEGPLVNDRAGVLVLSENVGAHEELGEWALTVNPFDVLGQAEALHAALSMDRSERVRRAGALSAQVRANDVGHWIDALLDDLARVSA